MSLVIEITMVGHSKGGGEAIVAAVLTGNDAMTFNAANFDFDSYGVFGTGKSTIDNYYVKGDILSSLIGPAVIGKTHWLKTPIKYNLLTAYSVEEMKSNHSMDYTILSLEGKTIPGGEWPTEKDFSSLFYT